MRALIALSALLLGACGPVSDDVSTPPAGTLAVEDPWAAPTPAGVNVSAGYLHINNTTTTPDRLLSATSPRAGRVEVHEMSMDGAVMRMRPVEALIIPAGGQANLAPGGMHLMFYDVEQPFSEGEQIPVELTFERAGRIDIVLEVRRNSSGSHAVH